MKTTILKIVIGLIFLIAFNVLFFLIGGTIHPASVWISYASIHLAYICLLITPLLCKTGKGETVLVASLWLRAVFYFFLAIAVGLFFIITKPLSPIWPAITQTALFVFFMIMQLMSVMANGATQSSLAKQRHESFYIRNMANNIRAALHNVSEPSLRKQTASLLESLNCSPIESFPQVASIEMELENSVNYLCSIMEQADSNIIKEQIKQTQNILRRRNQAVSMARYS